MSDFKIPDFVPEDITKPKSADLSFEEWRVFGSLCTLAVNRALRDNEDPVLVGTFAHRDALICRTYASLWIHQRARCGYLIAMTFAYLEAQGFLSILPSFLSAPYPNASVKPDRMLALFSAGPRLKNPAVAQFYKNATLWMHAMAIGEISPMVTQAIFGPEEGV